MILLHILTDGKKTNRNISKPILKITESNMNLKKTEEWLRENRKSKITKMNKIILRKLRNKKKNIFHCLDLFEKSNCKIANLNLKVTVKVAKKKQK